MERMRDEAESLSCESLGWSESASGGPGSMLPRGGISRLTDRGRLGRSKAGLPSARDWPKVRTLECVYCNGCSHVAAAVVQWLRMSPFP